MLPKSGVARSCAREIPRPACENAGPQMTPIKMKTRKHRNTTMSKAAAVPTTIAPWLSVRNAARAVEFYKSAFGGTEAFRMEEGGSVVARLSVEGAEFWVGDESPEHANFSPQSLNGSSVRIICW
jgi:hypothetical protein